MASVVNISHRNLISRIFLTKRKPVCIRWMTTEREVSKSVTGATDNKTKLDNVPDFTKPLSSKNWVSYGFDTKNAPEDKYKMHSLYFLVTVALVWLGFFAAYMPDYEHKNWARREAYIRLHEREKMGLEPIDKNYVDPKNMVLPSDEELGNFEIII